MENNIKRNKKHLDDSSKLPNLFKEIQDIRYGRAKPKEPEIDLKKEEIKLKQKYISNRKFNAIGIIIGILFLILFFSGIHSNYIFATTEKERVAISEFEENENTIDLMNVISVNISELTKKEIVNKEIEIPYETEYIENDLLPKDEQKVVQAGRLGFIERTLILTYENEELIDENIINEVTKNDPVKEIIEVGTSEFLANNKVHIGDIMYITEETPIYQSIEDDNEIGYVYQYIDVAILSEKDGIARVAVDDLEGYVDSRKLTSEIVTPGIAEKSRIAKIITDVNPDMPLNVPSRLTKDDFKKEVLKR